MVDDYCVVCVCLVGALIGDPLPVEPPGSKRKLSWKLGTGWNSPFMTTRCPETADGCANRVIEKMGRGKSSIKI